MEDEVEQLRGRLEALDEALAAQEQLVADLRVETHGNSHGF